MGYYSDIGLVLDKNASAILNGNLKTMNPEVADLFGKHADCVQADPETKAQFYFWKDVKSTEEEFEYIRLFINNLDDEQYYFLRLGEEYGDIEWEGCLDIPEFDLKVTARLVFNNLSSQEKTS